MSKSKIPPVREYTVDNTLLEYRYGKNMYENVELIDVSEPDDMWFHIADVPSAHLVMKMPADCTPQMVAFYVKQGAVLLKSVSSKYKSTPNLQVVYTRIKNVQHVDACKFPGKVTMTDEKYVCI